MTLPSVLSRVVASLDRAGIPYMVTGSVAGAFHGLPRATQDVDIVIAATADQVRTLVRLLPQSDYYRSESAALEAQRASSQFNVIDLATGWKIDFIQRKDRPFSREEFSRRRVVEVHGVMLAIATAEDVVVAKLEWARMGGSIRQIEDVAGLLRSRISDLDFDYIRSWVDDLDLRPQWTAACCAAGVAG